VQGVQQTWEHEDKLKCIKGGGCWAFENVNISPNWPIYVSFHKIVTSQARTFCDIVMM
jgi:hypothetical protein